ncbi:MAG: putative patatin/cPLA2 family phospholipase [Flavobacteriaceae bacterium]|jgi:predicted patatin/cPLA2 family phospholipase
MKKALIIQGGGFRTGFTAGILDAFMAFNYNPFDSYVGVSGGAIAASYYLSDQHGDCLNAMKYLAEDPEFVKFVRVMKDRGYMNIDQLRRVATEIVPFELDSALNAREKKEVHFVATNRSSGKPEYLSPTSEDWIESVIASCTLPFVTKGTHKVKGMDLMDGGWSDPLPVKWAVDRGATDLVVIRTSHIAQRATQTWPDYFGSVYFRAQKELSDCFANSHTYYNEALDFIANPPAHVNIQQIWPEEALKCSTYSYSVPNIKSDYRYGLHLGMKFIQRQIG